MLKWLQTFFLLSALAATSAAGADAPKTETVQFPAGKDVVSGFIAEPSTAGRHPALVVVHAWWGLNDWVKQQTERLAEQGFVALAVDLYGGHVATDAPGASQLRSSLTDEIAIRDIMAAYDYLGTRKWMLTWDHIGSLGWDMGGGYAIQLAIRQPRLAACAVNYGVLLTLTRTDDIQQIVATGSRESLARFDRGVTPTGCGQLAGKNHEEPQ